MIFRRRMFGFRIVEMGAFACMMALMFGVYLAKTNAGRERARIATVERQIAEEQRKLKLLRAEVAHLEQPERLGALSSAHLGLQPQDGAHEALIDTLPEIARPAEKTDPKPAVTLAPATVVAPPAAQPEPAVTVPAAPQ